MILQPQDGSDGSVERLRPAIAQYQPMPWSGRTAADLARSWVRRLAPGTDGLELPREILYALSDAIATHSGTEEKGVTFKRGTRADAPVEVDNAVGALVETHLPLVQYFVGQSMGWQQGRREFVPVTEDPRPGDPDPSPYTTRFKGRFGPLSNLAGPRAEWGERFSEVLGAVFLAATDYDGRSRSANFLTHAGYAAEHALYRLVEGDERGVVRIPIERMREVARAEAAEARGSDMPLSPQVAQDRRVVAPQPIDTLVVRRDNSDIDDELSEVRVTIADVATYPTTINQTVDPTRPVLESDLRSTLLRALDRLTPSQRRVLALKHGFDSCGKAGCQCQYGSYPHSRSEITQVLRVTGSAVNAHERNGLERLRRTATVSGLRDYRDWEDNQPGQAYGYSGNGQVVAPPGYYIEDTPIW